MGNCPEQNRRLPTRMACEYGPIAAGAAVVEMGFMLQRIGNNE
jgi:hypothetical protein